MTKMENVKLTEKEIKEIWDLLDKEKYVDVVIWINDNKGKSFIVNNNIYYVQEHARNRGDWSVGLPEYDVVIVCPSKTNGLITFNLDYSTDQGFEEDSTRQIIPDRVYEEIIEEE